MFSYCNVEIMAEKLAILRTGPAGCSRGVLILRFMWANIMEEYSQNLLASNAKEYLYDR